MVGARNHAVGIAGLDHHGAEVIVIVHLFQRIFGSYPLVFPQFKKHFGISREPGRVFGRNDFDSLHAPAFAPIITLHRFRTAENNRSGRSRFGNKMSRVENAVVFAFRQHDGLQVFRSFCQQPF